MTPERMREIASRRGSTSGVRWIAVQQQDGEWVIEDETGWRIANRIKRDADAQFIVHARGLDIPDLLGDLAAAEAERDRLRAALEEYGAHTGNCYPGGPRGDVEYHCVCGLNAALAGTTAAPDR